MPDDLAKPPDGYFPAPRDELIGRLKSGDEALRRAMHGSVQRFLKDVVVVEAEQPQQTLYRLVSGMMARLRVLQDGRRQIIGIFTPGDIVAVKAMLLNRQPDSIVCLSNCTVQTLDYATAIALASTDSDVSFRLMWQLAEDERRLHNNVAALGQGTAIERIATMLIDITGRRMKLASNGAVPAEFIDLRQQDIADYLGLTLVHVNRTLRLMREEGAIAVETKKITISDREAVMRYAAPMLDVFERETPEFNGRSVG